MTDRAKETDMATVLASARTIAIVGASPRENRPSHRVMAYLQRAGYRVLPVNPGQAGKKILGETVFETLLNIGEHIDIVDIFRRSDLVDPVVDEAITINAGAVWMQLGIVNETAAARARSAGLPVIMDRCIKTEHARLSL